jgi:hypothetical protein
MAKNMTKNEMESTNVLLRVIVALLLRQKSTETLSLKQQVAILDDLKLPPREIAAILGRSSIYVSKELVGLRKNRKKD